jgi:GntR family histidine utilization transcriptional repressor
MTGEARALHLRITEDLARSIRSGAWPPGHRIPFEHELTARYGCARATVNKAVTALAAAGLVERRRRAGSFVARPRIQSAVLEIPDIQEEVLRRGQTYGYDLLSRRQRLARGAVDGEISVGPVLELRCRHQAAGAPFALEERIISLDTAPEAADADFAAAPPGAWLLRHQPWTTARHQIRAVNPSPATARLLGIRPADACLCVRRWTWRGPAPITFVRQTFPGDRYDLAEGFGPGTSIP